MFQVHILQLKSQFWPSFEDYFVNSPHSCSIAELDPRHRCVQSTVNLSTFIYWHGGNKLVIPVQFFVNEEDDEDEEEEEELEEERGRGRRKRLFTTLADILSLLWKMSIEVLNFMNILPENICWKNGRYVCFYYIRYMQYTVEMAYKLCNIFGVQIL